MSDTGTLCLMCREWLPPGKEEHTCFDAYDVSQQRVRELEAENAKLRAAIKDMSECAFANAIWTAITNQ